MQLIKSLLSPRSRLQFEDEVKRILHDTGIKHKGLLPDKYTEIVNKHIANSKNPYKLMKLLISKLQDMDNLESIVKLLVIIHASLIDGAYQPEVLAALEDMELVINRKFTLDNNEQWFVLFYRAYCTYLAKLPSISELLVCFLEIDSKPPPNYCLTDLFRLLNQLALIMPALNSTINIIGRYYLRKILFFHELYSVLRKEILSFYSYLRLLINHFLAHY